MPSLLGTVLAGFGILILIVGLTAISVQAWLIGLIMLFFAFVLLYVGFALNVAPNFRSLYSRTSRVQMQQYRMNRSGSFSGYNNFQSSGMQDFYRNQLQYRSPGIQAGDFGASMSQIRKRKKAGWTLILVGLLFFLFGIIFSGVLFLLIYGAILAYSGFKILKNPNGVSLSYRQAQSLKNRGIELNYGQALPSMAQIVPEVSQDDGLD